MAKFIADTISHYDEDKRLHGVYVGLDIKNKPLLATVWGNTKERALIKAKAFAKLLNRVGEAGLLIADPNQN